MPATTAAVMVPAAVAEAVMAPAAVAEAVAKGVLQKKAD
jgi:hypothetical protein